MPEEDTTPVIIFILSLYAFAIVLLYVLAKAWEQALSTRPVDRGEPPRSSPASNATLERRSLPSPEKRRPQINGSEKHGIADTISRANDASR